MHLSPADGSYGLYTLMVSGFLWWSSYPSSAAQQPPEPRGGSLLLQSQSHGRHWFCTQPEWGVKTSFFVESKRILWSFVIMSYKRKRVQRA